MKKIIFISISCFFATCALSQKFTFYNNGIILKCEFENINNRVDLIVEIENTTINTVFVPKEISAYIVLNSSFFISIGSENIYGRYNASVELEKLIPNQKINRRVTFINYPKEILLDNNVVYTSLPQRIFFDIFLDESKIHERLNNFYINGSVFKEKALRSYFINEKCISPR